MGQKLIQDDKVQVYEAIAFVISAMPMEQAARSLREFSLDILQVVHAIANKPTPATKDELKTASGKSTHSSSTDSHSLGYLDALETLEVMLRVIDTFGDVLPSACQNSCQEAWVIFDLFIAKYGSDYDVCERTSRVLRFGLNFFGSTALPVVPAVLSRMAAEFESTGHASYLWIISKIFGRFGAEDNPGLRDSFKQIFEQVSAKLVSLLQGTAPSQVPDGALHFSCLAHTRFR